MGQLAALRSGYGYLKPFESLFPIAKTEKDTECAKQNFPLSRGLRDEWDEDSEEVQQLRC